MKVAIQGIEGSFHHEAAERMLGPDIELDPCKTFKQVFDAVRNEEADQGVVAIENSLYGSINPVYRQLARNVVWIEGETTLKVDQYLIGAKPLSLSAITRVMSQSPALEQCELWLADNLPEAHLEDTHDTAESVRYVVEHPDEPLAAIAGSRAAELYDGTILAGPTNDDEHNYTRFVLLRKGRIHNPAANKTSIILETSHQPGALHRALGTFAEAGVNLSKIDSHPIANDQRHYSFHIDFEAGLDEQFEHPVFDALRAQDCAITLLGSYKSSD